MSYLDAFLTAKICAQTLNRNINLKKWEKKSVSNVHEKNFNNKKQK